MVKFVKAGSWGMPIFFDGIERLSTHICNRYIYCSQPTSHIWGSLLINHFCSYIHSSSMNIVFIINKVQLCPLLFAVTSSIHIYIIITTFTFIPLLFITSWIVFMIIIIIVIIIVIIILSAFAAKKEFKCSLIFDLLALQLLCHVIISMICLTTGRGRFYNQKWSYANSHPFSGKSFRKPLWFT